MAQVKTGIRGNISSVARFLAVEGFIPAKPTEMLSAYFSTIIAGIIIGGVNETWPARLLVPLGWGYIRCMYQWLLRGHVAFSARIAAESYGKDHPDHPEIWGAIMRDFLRKHPVLGFYLKEYFIALAIALFFSILTGIFLAIF
jgi:hypothetical protein